MTSMLILMFKKGHSSPIKIFPPMNQVSTSRSKAESSGGKESVRWYLTPLLLREILLQATSSKVTLGTAISCLPSHHWLRFGKESRISSSTSLNIVSKASTKFWWFRVEFQFRW
jgi:hypothetical protein